MEQKPAEEVIEREAHDALLVSVGRVSPSEGNVVIGERNQSAVGDSHAMRIGAEIAKDVLWAAERRLAVDHPVLAEQYA